MKKAVASLPKIGLNARHRIIAEGGIPPLQYDYEREKWAMGERFGQYGIKSGVDIRCLWPSIEVYFYLILKIYFLFKGN